MKQFIQKYKHAWLLSYMFLYFTWFFYLESRGWVPLKIIHTALDDIIPFNEYFFIPYALWFLYIPAVVLFFLFKSRDDYYKTCAFLFTGMTICLIIYTIWPNGQNLRPHGFVRDNFLVDMVQKLYGFDTSTNVCPSIHVFNSIGAHIAIMESKLFKRNKLVRISSFVLAFFICLSTVFLKQHSVIDGLCAIILACVLYPIVYRIDYQAIRQYIRKKRRVYIDMP